MDVKCLRRCRRRLENAKVLVVINIHIKGIMKENVPVIYVSVVSFKKFSLSNCQKKIDQGP